MQKTTTVILFLLIISSTTLLSNDIEKKSEGFIESMKGEYKVLRKYTDKGKYLNVKSNWQMGYELKSKKAFTNIYDQRDYQEYEFEFYYYEDKGTCLKARNYYLEHYSFNGKLTPEIKGVKSAPRFSMIGDHFIIIAKVSCEGFKMDETWSWQRIKQELEKQFATPSSEIIENECGPIVRWENGKK